MEIIKLIKLRKIFAYLALPIVTSSLVYKIWLLINRKFFNVYRKLNSVEKKVYLNGISCSFPSNIYSQTQMKQMFIQNYCGGTKNILEKDLDFIERVFSAALIEKCHVDLSLNHLFARMKREEYTQYVKQTILSLSCQSAINAIQQSKFQIEQITHLVFGTMTGTISAPSMDIYIAKELGLNPHVKRLNVESMGCLTGFRLVGLCKDISLESETNVVLLIVSDVRSALGNQLTPFIPNQSIDKSNVIISALFRDSSGAAIISQNYSNNCSNLIDHRSSIIENTLELGRLKEFNDSSIHLYLDKQLPYAVFDYLPNFVNNFVREHSIDINQCQFAVHTGGPKIIRGIKECLNLRDEQLCASWFVMINYGNLSGSSNLVVLQHLIQWKYSKIPNSDQNIIFPKDFNQYKFIIGLSFGPGIALECVLFQY
jgi:predicted naringenin-chalcone synthase